MKSLNYRFPHSRQDSGQMSREKSQAPTTHFADPQSALAQTVQKIASQSTSQTTSANHSKKSSISTNPKTKQVQQMSFLNYLLMKDKPVQQEDEEFPECMQKNMFTFQYVIGIGGFGKVWKVDYKKSNHIYAMKEMSKALIIAKKSVNSVINERNILSNLKHPFLVNIYFAFQDRDNLYLVLDYMQGGDLRYHVGRMRRFSEDQTSNPNQNIQKRQGFLWHRYQTREFSIRQKWFLFYVLQFLGYVRITDLGIARVLRAENAQDTSGTPGYMAPEVMCRQNHSFAVDYFALGVIGYEFMLGKRPYVGKSRKEIRDQILAKQVQIKRSEIPDNWSLESADFINRLLQRKPANRLGFSGSHELRQHSWFKNFPWNKLLNKELKSPYLPNQAEDNFDARQISIEDEENNELIQQNALQLRRNSIQSLFQGYELDNFTQVTEPTKQFTQANY
ncbi:hypothetical protein pb186bvf_006239 [Paramecium bursaria]